MCVCVCVFLGLILIYAQTVSKFRKVLCHKLLIHLNLKILAHANLHITFYKGVGVVTSSHYRFAEVVELQQLCLKSILHIYPSDVFWAFIFYFYVLLSTVYFLILCRIVNCDFQQQTIFIIKKILQTFVKMNKILHDNFDVVHAM